ncbi:MAG: hypothetical protein AAB553_01665 [Patescibacteria group bacterium]
MKKHKLSLHIISREVFLYSLLTYLILLIAETLKKDIVNFFFNLNILLVIVLLGGFLSVCTHHEFVDSEKKSGILLKITSIFIVLFCGFFVFLMTQQLGEVGLIITGIMVLIVVVLSILVNLE